MRCYTIPKVGCENYVITRALRLGCDNIAVSLNNER